VLCICQLSLFASCHFGSSVADVKSTTTLLHFWTVLTTSYCLCSTAFALLPLFYCLSAKSYLFQDDQIVLGLVCVRELLWCHRRRGCANTMMFDHVIHACTMCKANIFVYTCTLIQLYRFGLHTTRFQLQSSIF